jgi:ABC-2 type transport system ATP-binding protein
MDEPVLWCKDLRKRFKERLAVDGVGFEVVPGETYGLLGPNGAGKTTTISMICGLLRRDGGEVTVAGVSLDDDPGRVKAAIGYVPQDVALYPDLSGLENLRFWGRMYGLAGGDLDQRVAETLEVVGLAERAGDKVADYSGGMERRLNIAAGLLHRPRLLVLDEPTAGVDPRAATPSSGTSRPWAARAWPCSTPPTTWRRPSASATGSGSSTRAAWSPRGPGASWWTGSGSATASS